MTKQQKLFDNLLTKEEIAIELGVSPATIANWMSSGKLPCIKIGKTHMGLRSMIERWIENQKVRKKCSKN